MMACALGPSRFSFERDVGDLCELSFEGQESSPGDESGEKTKAKGLDDARC